MNRAVTLLPVIMLAAIPHPAFATDLWLEADRELTTPSSVNKVPQNTNGGLHTNDKSLKLQKSAKDSASRPIPERSNQPGQSQKSTATQKSAD
jgi:hypothetical protein